MTWPFREFGGCNGSILKFHSPCQEDVFESFCQNDDACFGYVTNDQVNNTIECATFTNIEKSNEMLQGKCYTKERGKLVKQMKQICTHILFTNYLQPLIQPYSI